MWSTLTLPNRRLSLKFAGLAGFVVALTIGYFARATWVHEREVLQARLGETLRRVVATAALGIDGDAHETIVSPDDAKGPAFEKIRAYLERVRAVNGLAMEALYTFRIGEKADVHFAVMLQEQTFVGHSYQVIPSNLAAFRTCVSEKRATHTRLYEDDYGIWVSAYAPILDSKGRVAGVLEADFDAGVYKEAAETYLRNLVLDSMAAILLAFVLSGIFAYRVGQDLQSIRRGAEAIGNHEYAHRISVSRQDELGVVARQFNSMAAELSERFEMLKFIPRHTLEAIGRRSRQAHAPGIESLVGTVMFTDIRGYTSLSQELPAEEMVTILNTYLRSQAELIAARGGFIDKFIGDAVLAFFTGDDHEARAVQAALEIEAAIAEMNARGACRVPIHVGIGIASGTLVIGEIGSEERRERALVGSVVNLSARLCSKAGVDEVLATAEVALVLAERFEQGERRRLQLKGFSGDVEAVVMLTRRAGAEGRATGEGPQAPEAATAAGVAKVT